MKTQTRSFYETAVIQTVARIARSLDEALDLSELAQQAELSPFHFHRIFRGMVGETPLELHRRLRLERAAAKLLATAKPVTAIAFDAGYDTHEAFTRAFRDAYAGSPSAFRARAQDPAEGCVQQPRIQLAARCGIHFCPSIDLRALQLIRGESTMNVTIEEMPALRLATVPHVGPYNQISKAFQKLGGIAGPAGLFRPDALMIALYHDDPETTPAAKLRSDAGLTVSDNVKLPAEAVEKRLPAGHYARTTHIGPYTTLPDAWSRFLGEWLPASGKQIKDGVSFEMYRNDPSNTPPEQLRTDLYILLQGSMPKKIDLGTAPTVVGSRYPAPYDAPCVERFRKCLGDAAGLTQFGVNLMRLPPGCWSSQRHWHSVEDEFVFIVSGEVVLVTDAGEEVLRAGDSAGFKAGNADGHHLQNRSNAEAVLLEVGSRRPSEDAVMYSDIDLQIVKGKTGYMHKNGDPY
jgi:AraC family transcriptional regulator